MDIEIQEQIASSVRKNIELCVYNMPKVEVENLLLAIHNNFNKTTDATGNIISDYSIHLEKFLYFVNLIKPCLSYHTYQGFPILKLLFSEENNREFKNIQQYIKLKLKPHKQETNDYHIFMDGSDD